MNKKYIIFSFAIFFSGSLLVATPCLEFPESGVALEIAQQAHVPYLKPNGTVINCKAIVEAGQKTFVAINHGILAVWESVQKSAASVYDNPVQSLTTTKESVTSCVKSHPYITAGVVLGLIGAVTLYNKKSQKNKK